MVKQYAYMLIQLQWLIISLNFGVEMSKFLSQLKIEKNFKNLSLLFHLIAIEPTIVGYFSAEANIKITDKRDYDKSVLRVETGKHCNI
jgi:hypothetical protein